MMLPVDVNDSDLGCDYYLDYDYDYRLSLIALNLFLASSYFHSSTANPLTVNPGSTPIAIVIAIGIL